MRYLCLNFKNHVIFTETHSRLNEASKENLFARIVNGFNLRLLLTISPKSSFKHVAWKGPKLIKCFTTQLTFTCSNRNTTKWREIGFYY